MSRTETRTAVVKDAWQSLVHCYEQVGRMNQEYFDSDPCNLGGMYGADHTEAAHAFLRLAVFEMGEAWNLLDESMMRERREAVTGG